MASERNSGRFAFRILVILNILAFAISLLVESMASRGAPEGARKFLDNNISFVDENPIFGVFIFLILASSQIVSWIGLLFFWRPAKQVFLFMIAFFYCTMPLYGFVLNSPYVSIASGFDTLTTGAIAGILIFGNYNSLCDKK